MTMPVRLTVVLTHPIQYYAPWFRYIEAHAPALALTVLHATEPTPEQQGVGYGQAFSWDVPLTGGYGSRTSRPPKAGDSVDTGRFFGLDVPEISQAIDDTRPDVVLVPGWYSVTLVRALMACRRRGIPVLYRGDTHALNAPRGWSRAAWAAKTWLLLRQFDGYLSTGSRVRAHLRSFGVPEYRIFDVPAAVDNDRFAAAAAQRRDPEQRAAARRRFGIEPDAFVPLFVGRLAGWKRPLDLVRAAAAVSAGTTLLVVGSGRFEAGMRDEAARLGVDLRLAGFVNQSELGDAYAAADCLTLPSESETWGLVVNEALAAGLPCVVSDAVGCAPDLVREGETGYVHPRGDIGGLAAGLAAVRERKADGYRWDDACRQAAGAYSYATATEGLVRACRSVIRHSPGPEPDSRSATQRMLACCGQMVIAGGLERMTLQVVRVLQERGIRVHCVVNSWENFRITPLVEAAGATWSTGPYWYPLTRRRLNPAKLARMICEIVSVSANTLREARRIDATHVFLPEFLVVLRNVPALLWLRVRGVKVVVRLGNAPDRSRFYHRLWRSVVSPCVDAIVCNSGFTYRELAATGVPMRKARIISNTAAPRHEAWKRSSPIPGRIVYVGQIIPAKGLDLLLDAVAILRGRGLDATLDVVGEMGGWESPAERGYRASLRARAAHPDLAGQVNFLGWREDVPTLMSRAAVHCCPSRPEQREAFGNVVLEAKLSGVPSVVTPSGDLPDLVDHQRNGWVCTESTAVALVEGLAYFLTDARVGEEAGRAALASASEFSGARFAAAWLETFSPDAPISAAAGSSSSSALPPVRQKT